MARAKALADLGDTDLLEKLSDSKEELFNLRLQKATSQLEKPARLRKIRRDIARIETQMSALRHQAAKA